MGAAVNCELVFKLDRGDWLSDVNPVTDEGESRKASSSKQKFVNLFILFIVCLYCFVEGRGDTAFNFKEKTDTIDNFDNLWRSRHVIILPPCVMLSDDPGFCQLPSISQLFINFCWFLNRGVTDWGWNTAQTPKQCLFFFVEDNDTTLWWQPHPSLSLVLRIRVILV